jgi:hypothetical protein
MVEAEEERLVEALTARLADVIRAASSTPARVAAE